MYYRYKSKRRDYGYLKVLFAVVVIVPLVFLAVHYHEYLMFWRYSQNTLEQRLQRVSAMPASAEKTAELAELQVIADTFLEENPLSADAFFLAARLGFIRGEAALTGISRRGFAADRVRCPRGAPGVS
jgi:cytochrome c-type biogenesis protein CcmH/NrfG